MKQLAALGLAALLLAACQRGHSHVAAAPPAPEPAAPAPAANPAEAMANETGPPIPADVDPDNPYEVFEARATAAKAADAAKAKGGVRIHYGVLGDPLDDPLGWEEHDPDFFGQTTQQKLALFRQRELHPGNPDGRPMNWDAVEAVQASQRALYYAVLEDAPQLITAQDRQWLKADEAYLIHTACGNRGQAGVLFDIPKKDCPRERQSPR